MKIAAFYENILTGAEAKKISVSDAVRGLQANGLESLYIQGRTVQTRRKELELFLHETGLAVEGLYTILDLGGYPESAEAEELILEAKRFGAGNVLIVPGMIGPELEIRRAEPLANMKMGLRRAVRFGEEQGVRVTLEDFDSLDSPFCSVKGLYSFMSSVPGLCCSFDTGNFLHGEDPLSALPLFRERLCNIHLKDRSHEPSEGDSTGKRCVDGSKVYVVPVGDGYIPMPGILHQLHAWGFTGTVIVELYDYNPSMMLEGLHSSLRWTREQLNLIN